MADRPFRQQYRPVDPEQIAEALTHQPRLLAVEVIAIEHAAAARYGCRVVDVVADEELARDAGHAPDSAKGELLAAARGLQLVAEIEPDARVVLRGSAEFVDRVGCHPLPDPAPVEAIAAAQ